MTVNNSYCLLSIGGAPIELVRKYIENQKIVEEWQASHPDGKKIDCERYNGFLAYQTEVSISL